MQLYNGSERDLVVYVDSMGCDEAVCDAARVSMDKQADMYTPAQNEKLIQYLAKNNHWSPFAHCSVKLRFKAPIFVARQLVKHQVGFAWNEVSRRYVSTEPSFWCPVEWRLKAENVKQGSSNVIHEDSFNHTTALEEHIDDSLVLYDQLLDAGVCAEQARIVLPQNMMTDWIWTGSLYAWSRMYGLRSDPHAQLECRIYADLVRNIVGDIFPLSWRALTER